MTHQFVVYETKYAADDGNGTLSGYGSVYGNIDTAGDIIAQGAFAKSINDKKSAASPVPFLWNHDPSQPIGSIDEISEDRRGLHIKVKLDLNVQKAREVYSLIKNGVVKGLSVGFQTVKADMDKRGVRTIKEAKLWEVSAVTFPCNQEALISTIKKLDLEQSLTSVNTIVEQADVNDEPIVVSKSQLDNLISLRDLLETVTKSVEISDAGTEGGTSAGVEDADGEAENGQSSDSQSNEPLVEQPDPAEQLRKSAEASRLLELKALVDSLKNTI